MGKAVLISYNGLKRSLGVAQTYLSLQSTSALIDQSTFECQRYKGLIRYSAFESEIEAIVIQGDMAITLGRETVKPIGNAPMAGQTVLRRYTHVWLRKDGRWRQLARHANIVCAEPLKTAK